MLDEELAPELELVVDEDEPELELVDVLVVVFLSSPHAAASVVASAMARR